MEAAHGAQLRRHRGGPAAAAERLAQPPKPQITPSTMILQLAAELDTSPGVDD